MKKNMVANGLVFLFSFVLLIMGMDVWYGSWVEGSYLARVLYICAIVCTMSGVVDMLLYKNVLLDPSSDKKFKKQFKVRTLIYMAYLALVSVVAIVLDPARDVLLYFGVIALIAVVGFIWTIRTDWTIE